MYNASGHEKAELLGSTTGNVRVLLKGTVNQLRARAKVYKCNGHPLKHWAIYVCYTKWGHFHNATDDRFLVEHWQDLFWLNNGVESV